MKIFKKIFLVAIVAILCSSCGFSKIANQVEVKGISNFEMKGMTGLAFDAFIVNESPYNIEMSEAEVTLYQGSKKMVHLIQVGEGVSAKESRENVATLWRISSVDPRMISSFISRLSKRNFDDITISYTVRFSTKGVGRKFSQENIDLKKFIAIFAGDAKERDNDKKSR